MAKVAYPSMKKLRLLRPRSSTGAIAAGGTLGILIPPSTIMVIYGIMTETNIGKLFAAGILPGHARDVAAVPGGAVDHLARPAGRARAASARSWRERLRALEGVWAVALLFVLVMGGIYGGVFTATEGAGIGAFGAFVLRAGAPRADLAHAARRAGGERAHHRDAVH